MFDFIVDGGHGWLKVDVKKFPFAKQFADGYGYKRGNFVYLEEDCQAPKFIAEFQKRGGEFICNEVYVGDEWVGRNWNRF